MIDKFIKFIPHLFTLMNLFGVLGIIFCLMITFFRCSWYGTGSFWKNIGVIFGFNNRLLSSFMIFGAAVLDFLDGFVARR
jgi:phosphatidylserine synthase